MLKTLLKKQLLEIFCKEAKGKNGKKTANAKPLIVYALVYLIVFAFVGVYMYLMADLLCAPFVAAGFTWLYFAIMGLVAIAVGVIGSVFSTYSSLYLAKDNDMLLAMPIKPRTILAARLLSVVLSGFVFQFVVMGPTLICYYINVGAVTATSIIMPLLCLPVLTAFITGLSCVLGWVVAIISTKLKGKSYVTVIISLAIIVAYYTLYSKAYTLLTSMVANPTVYAVKVKRYLYPLYKMGNGAAGDAVDMLICALFCLALFAAIYTVLSRTFLKIATASVASSVKKTKLGGIKTASVSAALYRKELKRFTSSATYMLNCGLGAVMMLVLAVVLFVKGGDIVGVLKMLPLPAGTVELISVAILCTTLSMCYVSAPSISLEGKNLWLTQMMPVSPMQVLGAKIKLHLSITVPPYVVLISAVLYMLRPDLTYCLLMVAVSGAYLIFICFVGLCLNLKMPNFNWTSETVPVKQSMPVTLCFMGGWALTAIFGGVYWLLHKTLSPTVFLGAVTAVLFLLCVWLYLWLKKRGTVIFTNL